jgi:hypothetical protein
MKKTLFAIAIVAMIGCCSTLGSAATLDSGAQPITLKATLAESLTLTLSASSVDFTLAAGSATNAGSTGVKATTKWVLNPSRGAVTVDAYFASATSALADASGNNIPSSAFQISNNGGASAALTSSVAFGATSAGLRLENVTITGANKNSQAVDNMTFNIDLSAAPLPQLPAGTYNGTLNIQAQATP